MKPILLILCSLTILLFTSCSDDDAQPVVETLSDYINFEVGNYWVYEWYEIQPDGTESSFAKRDSLYISADTLIDGRRFWIRSGTFLGNENRWILFDSAEALFTYPDRVALFSLDPNMETTSYFGLPDSPIAVGTYMLNPVSSTLRVPAGDFESLNFEGRIESLQTNYQHGTRFNDNWYAKGIGLVQLKTQFYVLPSDLEMRLVDFGKN